ncbi:LysR family transcriptional regulator [Curtobacterium sp. MCBD17_034]|uniref:LysR family transcriptional regulator n=1 Tax=unclassified Curtobacterium TaxID=257496 RepID=UPI000DA7ED17|nr:MULTISPECIES: LysR family transcriptional regulator [unclassified Curtobacterium]PZF62316.1 LysR family transcriptional regulator [Curtobacterium sp. MCBD17_034]PZM39977.1 LysR family transcriptional regulator [Curtobacterium sp. MCBD17_031]WIB63943.1 LysR family transcriptional regulator [Curtobacterium sp. MCBD17_040]
METRLLEQFVAVADEGNVTRAAARLFAAQSTVSAGLQSLERELGGALFDRVGRRLTLSPLGEALLPDARAALGAVERLRDGAVTADAQLRGRVRVGIFANMDIVDLPRIITTFHARHPLVDVHLSASAAGTTGLAEDLRAGRLDLAFTALPQDPPGIAVTPLRALPFRVYVAPRHRLADHAVVSLAELADEPFVDTARGFGNRIILDAALRDRGIRRRIVAEMNDLPSVVRFAATGLGVAVVPDPGTAGDAVVLELADPVEPLRVGLATAAGAALNRATRALARAVVGGTDGGTGGGTDGSTGRVGSAERSAGSDQAADGSSSR